MKKLALALLLFATPALAEPSPSDRAMTQTIQELTQAWIGARTALLAAQDQITVDQAKIKELQDKLPRQEPVRGPSGTGSPGTSGMPSIAPKAETP